MQWFSVVLAIWILLVIILSLGTLSIFRIIFLFKGIYLSRKTSA